jgi:phytoene dehydrogenase-like protein
LRVHRDRWNPLPDAYDHVLIDGRRFDYPIGGARAMATSLLPAIERAGGMLVTSAEVAAIALDGGDRVRGVRMIDGCERAATVISDVGVHNTFADKGR